MRISINVWNEMITLPVLQDKHKPGYDHSVRNTNSCYKTEFRRYVIPIIKCIRIFKLSVANVFHIKYNKLKRDSD